MIAASLKRLPTRDQCALVFMTLCTLAATTIGLRVFLLSPPLAMLVFSFSLFGVVGVYVSAKESLRDFDSRNEENERIRLFLEMNQHTVIKFNDHCYRVLELDMDNKRVHLRSLGERLDLWVGVCDPGLRTP